MNKDSRKRKITRKVGRPSDDEDTVTLKVKISGKEVSAVLDTGAKPSVIDRKTLAQLGLSGHIQPVRSRVFGLGQKPVPVPGRVEADVNIGQAAATTYFYVSDSDEPTLLLGREFMICFDRVTFDFIKGQIGLGKTWVPIQGRIQSFKKGGLLIHK